MNKRTTDIVAYLTWVGLLIALVAGDRDASRFHLNQSLVIWLTGTICGILGHVFLVGWLISAIGGCSAVSAGLSVSSTPCRVWRRKYPC